MERIVREVKREVVGCYRVKDILRVESILRRVLLMVMQRSLEGEN